MFRRLMGKVKFHRSEVPMDAADQQESDQLQQELYEELLALETDLNDPDTAAVVMSVAELLMSRRAMFQRHLEQEDGLPTQLALFGSSATMGIELQTLAESIVYKHGRDVESKCTFCGDD